MKLFLPFFPASVFKKESSPGPGYMVHPSITRFGKDGTPKYSILGRQKDPSIPSLFFRINLNIYTKKMLSLKKLTRGFNL